MAMNRIGAEGGGVSREPGRMAAGMASLPGYPVEVLEWTEALVLGSAGDAWPGVELRP